MIGTHLPSDLLRGFGARRGVPPNLTFAVQQNTKKNFPTTSVQINCPILLPFTYNYFPLIPRKPKESNHFLFHRLQQFKALYFPDSFTIHIPSWRGTTICSHLSYDYVT